MRKHADNKGQRKMNDLQDTDGTWAAWAFSDNTRVNLFDPEDSNNCDADEKPFYDYEMFSSRLLECFNCIRLFKCCSGDVQRYYDGGMTDNLPVFSDGRTVSVSPFDGGQEICPSSGQVDTRDRLHMIISNQSYRVNLQNIVRCIHAFAPPSDMVLDAYHHQGMCDAKKFLVTQGYFDP